MNSPPAWTAGRAAAVAVALGLAVRLALALHLGARFFWPDESMYHAHAVRVAQGQFVGPRAFSFVPPGQYFTLGSVYALAGPHVLAARIFLALVSAASVWLLFRLVRRLSPGAAALAAFSMAFYPLIVYTAGTLYPQTLAAFWLLAAVNVLSDHVERPSWGRIAGAGALLGCGALTVPTILTVCPLLGIWLWWARGARWRGVLETAGLAACVTLALVPWEIRNYRVEGRFIPVASVGSQIFFFANNPNANPDSKDIALVDKVYTPEIREEIRRTGDENGVYARHAAEFIRHDTGLFLLYYGKRLRHFFDFTPHTFTSNEHTGRWARLAVGLTSGPALLLALLGAAGLVRRSRVAALWVLLPLGWGLASAMFGVTIRYRVPVEPYILATAAWALWHYGLRRRDGSRDASPTMAVRDA